jgi:DNA-binding transcriptional ArsR family regulator
VKEIAAPRAHELDPVWKALSDSTRRAILDFLRAGPRSTTEIVESFPQLSRFGVMKHLDVLRQADLVSTREAGRQRVNSLNVVPIRQIYERWVTPFQELWAGELLRIKEFAEAPGPRRTHATSRRSKTIRPAAAPDKRKRRQTSTPK